MGRRTLLLIAALVVAALGTALVWLYAANAQKAAQQGQTLKTVLVAKDKIEVGTTGSAAASNGAFQQTEVPADTVVPGAISDATPIANLVALVPIFPGQQIIGQQWGTAGQTGGLAIPAGKVAISVQLGDPERVAGFVAPGSTVGIFTTGSVGGTGTGSTGVVKMLLTNVPVLAVGPTTVVSSGTASSGTSTGNTEQIPTAILTLAVTQDEAEKIIYASGKTPGSTFSGLYFALTNADSKLSLNEPGTSAANLFK